MATTKQLNTKIVSCHDTTANWSTSVKVLLKGEIAIEELTDGTFKFKIGDGTHVFSALPYAALKPSEITALIQEASHTHSNKAILDAITASYTTEEETKLGNIATGAQVNVIEDVKVNGTSQTVTNKAVDITVPSGTFSLTTTPAPITQLSPIVTPLSTTTLVPNQQCFPI